MFMPPNISKIDKDIDRFEKLIPQGTPAMNKEFKAMNKEFSKMSTLPGVTQNGSFYLNR
jgi:hypothetical protein